MRITTNNAFESSVANLQRRQQQLTTVQDQLTSGKRVQRASDDPAAAAVAERALAAASRSDAQMRAVQSSRSATELTESALGDAGELMQQAREALVAAGNGSYGDTARSELADRIRGLRNELLALANRSDGSGRHLFGGQGSEGPPLVDGPGGVAFAGTAGQSDAIAGGGLPLAVDGRAVWLQADDPSNPGQPLSLFDSLDRVADELSTAGRSSADVMQTVSRGLAEFDSVATNVSAWRSRAGVTLNRLEALGERIAQDKLDSQTQRSDAEDLDMLAAISDFQNRQSGYDAALKTYSIVQRMSLFEYVR